MKRLVLLGLVSLFLIAGLMVAGCDDSGGNSSKGCIGDGDCVHPAYMGGPSKFCTDDKCAAVKRIYQPGYSLVNCDCK